MKFKLANGNVVASTKQPVQWKDFDRIEVTDDYESSWLPEYGTFDEGGRPDNGDLEFTVKLYNPSTHMIRKSHHYNNCYQIRLKTQIRGSDGNRYNNTKNDGYMSGQDRLYQLDYGDVWEGYFYPSLEHISKNWSHLVNPFKENWGYSYQDPIDNYIPDTFEYNYLVQLIGPRVGGQGYGTPNNGIQSDKKIRYTKEHWIKYKVH